MRRSSRRRRGRSGWAPYVAALGAAAVAAVTSRALDSRQLLEGLDDTARHVVAYGALAVAVGTSACAAARELRLGVALFALLVCFGLGITQELRQALRGHPIEWGDIAANVLGSSIGVAVVAALGVPLTLTRRRARSRRRPRRRRT